MKSRSQSSFRLLANKQQESLYTLLDRLQETYRGVDYASIVLSQDEHYNLICSAGEFNPKNPKTLESLLSQVRTMFVGISFQDVILSVENRSIVLSGTQVLYGNCQPL